MDARRSSRDAARHALREEVELWGARELPSGRLEVWRGVEGVPPRVAPFYVSPDGAFFRTDTSWKDFERMLASARVELADSALLALLITYAPGRRSVAVDERLVPDEYRLTDWAPQRLADGSWVAHCIDYDDGHWERVRIETDYHTTVVVLGPASKFPRR